MTEDDVEAQQLPGAAAPSTHRLPVLIIPGFMSSGLEVRESSVNSTWVGKRVWINLSALGFESLHGGSALVRNEEKKEHQDAELHLKYEQELSAKSRWVEHMSLTSDMKTERRGMCVRAIEGLTGVDYLTPGALTNHVSYVFGPVIQALQAAGYTDDNLDAAPYDWRIPPAVLEARDGYFTSTMRKVEQMYQRNNETPVVLVCHSLGCRTAHYFLNFCKAARGQDWLDKYVHTYMPVGAPSLGAPKALRAMVSGDKMGLDAFLSDEEGLILGRSFGSGAWLLPMRMPAGAPPNAFLRREGILEVTVSAIALQSLLIGREDNPPDKLYLSIVCNGKTLATKSQSLGADKRSIEFPDVFMFAVPLQTNENSPNGILELILQEPGAQTASMKEKKRKTGLYYSFLCFPVRFILGLLICLINYTIFLPFTILWKILQSVFGVTAWTVDATAKAAGAKTKLASSGPMSIKAMLPAGQTQAKHAVTVAHAERYQKAASCSTRGMPRECKATVSLRWTVPPSTTTATSERGLISTLTPPGPPGDSTTQLRLKSRKEGGSVYEPVSGDDVLTMEGFESVISLVKDCYGADPLGPRSTSSIDAPPVKRVKAVYGINLPTEVGAVYRRTNLIPREGTVQGLHILDTSAIAASTNYEVKGGIIFETKGTPQWAIQDESSTTTASSVQLRRSGDGTVPYWSLQHCRTWQGPCEVSVHEIEGAEHREILANKQFHAVLINYVVTK